MREEPHEELGDAVLVADLDTALKGNPRALVFAVAALDLLVLARLDLLLEDLGAAALVDTCNLENLSGIEPTVGLAPHDGDAVDLHLVDVDPGVDSLGMWRQKHIWEQAKRDEHTE